MFHPGRTEKTDELVPKLDVRKLVNSDCHGVRRLAADQRTQNELRARTVERMRFGPGGSVSLEAATAVYDNLSSIGAVIVFPA